MRQARILVVEDERITAHDIEATLQGLGHEVPAITDTGEDALDKVEALRPDLVLLDIRLKGALDGVAVADEIRRRHQIPVVYLTANADPETVERATRTEAYGYLLKPFSEQELHTTIQIALYKADAERAMRAAREEAERASQAKTELLSRTSHELRTPLNAILGFAQLLEADPTVEDQESVEQILTAGRHLLALVDEVLDLATIEAGKINFSFAPTPVAEVLAHSLDLVRHLAAQQRISVDPGAALRSGEVVWTDRERLKQVMVNLLTNAIQHNREGGSVVLSCEETSDQKVRIAVRDTGPGIPPEERGKLFVPFERLDAERRGVRGTGLGLAISKGLVERMHGRLGVDARSGEGSTFWVELPRAETSPGEPAAVQAAGAEDPEVNDHGTPTVLYIEDNPANLRLVERILSRQSLARLISAVDGGTGLRVAQQQRPQLILLDLMLPDLSGEEVFQQLRRDPSTCEIPVVVMSADAHPEQISHMLALGVVAYLTKPLNVPEFIATLTEHLGKSG